MFTWEIISQRTVRNSDFCLNSIQTKVWIPSHQSQHKIMRDPVCQVTTALAKQSHRTLQDNVFSRDPVCPHKFSWQWLLQWRQVSVGTQSVPDSVNSTFVNVGFKREQQWQAWMPESSPLELNLSKPPPSLLLFRLLSEWHSGKWREGIQTNGWTLFRQKSEFFQGIQTFVWILWAFRQKSEFPSLVRWVMTRACLAKQMKWLSIKKWDFYQLSLLCNTS